MKDVQATIIIDLEGKTEQGLWMGIEHSRRKNIKRAKSYNLSFGEASEKDWQDYYEIYSRVWKTGGVNPEPIEKLKQPSYKLFVVKHQDKVVGGGLIEIKDDSINFVAFAALDEFAYMRVNDFLYWNSIIWAFNNKKKFVDLGGYQLKPLGHMVGINTFKERWGGRIVTYDVRGSYVYLIGRKAIRNIPAARWLWDRLKKRPNAEKRNYRSPLSVNKEKSSA